MQVIIKIVKKCADMTEVYFILLHYIKIYYIIYYCIIHDVKFCILAFKMLQKNYFDDAIT